MIAFSLLAAPSGPFSVGFVLLLALSWIVFITTGVMFIMSRLSGWTRLAERFAAQGSFDGSTWAWQSGRLRGWCNYNNCLRLGADQLGFYLAVMMPFALFHTPLYVPWDEVQVETGKVLFGLIDTALLRLGREEQVGVRVYGRMVDRLRQAAGTGWPNFAAEQMMGTLPQ